MAVGFLASKREGQQDYYADHASQFAIINRQLESWRSSRQHRKRNRMDSKMEMLDAYTQYCPIPNGCARCTLAYHCGLVRLAEVLKISREDATEFIWYAPPYILRGKPIYERIEAIAGIVHRKK